MNAVYKSLRTARPFFLIAGPCAIESHDLAMRTAEHICNLGSKLSIPVIYKSSFDKANRTSGESARGVGLDDGLRILEHVNREFGIPLCTDIHESWQAEPVGSIVDVIQIPALLCRQTDLLVAAGKTGRIINVKKGQFADPNTMAHAIGKINDAGNAMTMVCERGAMFGYGDLVMDPRSLVKLRDTRSLVVQDVTHSVQKPGGEGSFSGGGREFIPSIARAAAAVGVNGFFMETHPDPPNALSDAKCVYPMDILDDLISELVDIANVSKGSTDAWDANGK